jgi:hypothetical protein
MTKKQLIEDIFYSLYATSDAFRELLSSAGNEDSKTGNRMFDRHVAVRMIKNAAADAKDSVTATAKDGDIYKHVVALMRQNDQGGIVTGSHRLINRREG